MESPVNVEKSIISSISTVANKSQARILGHYVIKTLPQVQKLLTQWQKELEICPDGELKNQALASLRLKEFHCQGGAVFAVPYAEAEPTLLRLITAYQTICDYLDNLCDRAGCTDPVAFRQLHQSLLDALTPGKPQQNYYKYYPYQDDGGYLHKLVEECWICLESLPSYSVVYRDAIQLANWYIELQVKKHIRPGIRERVLQEWAEQHLPAFPGIWWQEFAAACGSTLALFALLGLATRENISSLESRNIFTSYFPWICGLHILLDYFIDRDEDLKGGDLNFTFFYKDENEMLSRLELFVNKSHRCALNLSYPVFHRTVVDGLLAMYLSDNKVSQQGFKHMARKLLVKSGVRSIMTYQLCCLVRRYIKG